jgi:TPR repeat protein
MHLKTSLLIPIACCGVSLAQVSLPAPSSISVEEIVKQSNERRAQALEALAQGIVRVEAQNRVTDTGTGMVVSCSPERILILTALHVVKDATSVDVVFYADRSTHVPARILPSRSDLLDLAVLEVTPGPNSRLPHDIQPYHFVVSSTIQPGEDIFTANGEWVPVRNSVTRLNHDGDAQKFEYTNVSVGRGFSGGPIFDQYGNVIGMHDELTGGGNGGGNFAVGIKIDSALQTLEALDYTVPKADSKLLSQVGLGAGAPDVSRGNTPATGTEQRSLNAATSDMEHYTAAVMSRDPDRMEAEADKISNPSLANSVRTLAARLRTSASGAVPSVGTPAGQADIKSAAARNNRNRLWLQAESVLNQRNYTKALPLFQQLAESGDSESMATLGNLYYNGWGAAQNYAEAARWFQKAAEQGETRVMSTLALMYASGRGVPQNDALALQWNRKAAEVGDPIAMLGLGAFYENGRGVPKDRNQAAEWYRKAAALGNATAKQNLQRMGMSQ